MSKFRSAGNKPRTHLRLPLLPLTEAGQATVEQALRSAGLVA